jgi:NAD(P)-dependent dehydrogenase (short-subunit alcohol dehydrogenase family)
MAPLAGKVALVAGATRGAGRGVARALGEAGAIVYCSGRSTRGHPPASGPFKGRLESIDETAALVQAAGGTAVAVPCDHADDAEVGRLVARIRRDHGRLDVLVNDFWGGPEVTQWGEFWTHALDRSRALTAAAWPHVLTCRHVAPLMLERREGLIVQMTEGDALYYRRNLYYDLGRTAEVRLAYALAEELGPHGISALAVTPGYLRAEATLDGFGVTEATWREAIGKDPNFAASETPHFVGRAIAALAADPHVSRKAGGLYSSWGLAREYGFTDADGSRPDFGRHFAEQFGESPVPLHSAVRWRIERRS